MASGNNDLCSGEEALLLFGVLTTLQKRPIAESLSELQTVVQKPDCLTMLQTRSRFPLSLCPVWYCVQHRMADHLRVLLKQGASPDQVNEEGLSMLHLTVIWGEREMADILVEYGADSGATAELTMWHDETGQLRPTYLQGTPLDFARRIACTPRAPRQTEAIIEILKGKPVGSYSSAELVDLIATKEREVKEANDIKFNIEIKTIGLNNINWQIKSQCNIYADLMSCVSMEHSMEVMRRREKNSAAMMISKTSMKMDLHRLRRSPAYRPDRKLAQLETELEALKAQRDRLEAATRRVQEHPVDVAQLKVENETMREKLNDAMPLCPVCYEVPTVLKCCQQCDNILCQTCQQRLPRCPSCREDFSVRPPLRNKCAERIVKRMAELLRGV